MGRCAAEKAGVGLLLGCITQVLARSTVFLAHGTIFKECPTWLGLALPASAESQALRGASASISTALPGLVKRVPTTEQNRPSSVHAGSTITSPQQCHRDTPETEEERPSRNGHPRYLMDYVLMDNPSIRPSRGAPCQQSGRQARRRKGCLCVCVILDSKTESGLSGRSRLCRSN